MAYINQVQVGSTTYDIRDKRLENPVDFAGVITQGTGSITSMTLTVGAEETDQWKVGSTVNPAWIVETEEGMNTREVKFSASSPGASYKRLYPGDLVYGYHGATATSYYVWAVVPSADNPHTHSIPALSGSAASNGAHSHSVTASGTLSTAGGHSHTVNVSASVTSGNNHSHTYTVPTQADSAGGHTHTVTFSASPEVVSTARTGTDGGSITSTFTGTSANTNEKGGHTHTVTMNSHSHSVTASGTLSTSGSHSHKVTYSKASASGTSIPAAVSGNTLVFSTSYVTGITNTATEVTSAENGGHSHTFTGSSVNTGWATSTVKSVSTDGAHTHSVTATGTISNTVVWPLYQGIATITAVGATVSTNGAHSHALSGTSAAKNTGTAAVAISVTATLDSAGSHSHTFTGSSVNTSETGAHTHTVSTTASTTGTGQ